MSDETRRARVSRARQQLRAEAGRELPPLEPAPRDGDLPLSFAQHRLWFLDQLQPGASTYNIPAAWRLNGSLDVAALARSVVAVVGRHEALRTRVELRGGGPVQVVGQAPREVLELTDITALAPAAREARAQALFEAHARQAFDLSTGPLFRAHLLRLASDEHVLLVNMHHIASDGWSNGVFQRELSAAYGALVRGVEPDFPALPVQYADYAIWQRAWLQGSVLATQRSYWQRQLSELSPLDLPLDRPRPPVARYRGASLMTYVPTTTSSSLTALSRREGATLFMTLLAAFQVLLSRYSGQTDIAVGTPIAGRGHPDLEGLIGCFVNTLVLRADVSGNPSFRALIARVRETALGAYAHQDLPFEKLVEDFAPARDLSRHPLFQVLFVLHNTPNTPLALEGLVVDRLPRESQSAKFDLNLSVRESADGLHLRWEYATDLFEAETVKRLAGHFQCLLDAVVASPEQGIDQLSLLTSEERQQLLVAWNNTVTGKPRDRCIHELVEAQAARTPDAVAAIDAVSQLTYATLNARANQVAHYLKALGVGPDVPVAICLERSFDLIVGVLGILKAGGAYVPLDPGYPEARLAFMLADSQASALVTRHTLVPSLPSFEGHMLCVDREETQLLAQPSINLENAARPEALAYVIYTSGSTGTPKGVAIEHRNSVTFLRWAATVFSERELAGTLFSTSICFDLSVFELFAPLSRGAAVVVAEDVLALPTHPFADRVTLINTVPSAMTELLRLRGVPESVCTINLAGEALHGPLVRSLFESTTVEKVYNLYGPTEDTTYSTLARLARGTELPSIGRPIANTQVYVLDRYLAPVPVGVAGELYLGGDGVARGYWRRPGMTTTRFVPDPFGSTPGARMYRTGDRVRYLTNGDLEFLGRLDDQVKIRGFRIELGEIEALLNGHAAVHQAVVLAREDTPGDNRLVAYVVPGDPAGVDVDALRVFVQARLPEHLQPAAYVVLGELPRTPTGKLDRRALPAPSYGRHTGTAFVGPRDVFEETIAQVWRDLLRIESVGVHDNFFELSGHSLLATQVVARISQLLQVDLSLRSFFEAPSIAGLAAAVHRSSPIEEGDRVHDGARKSSAVAIVARGTGSCDHDLPVSFAQQRLWFIDRLDPGTSTYSMPAAWRLAGPLDIAALARSVAAVAARHESLRTRIALRGGVPVQVIDPPAQELLEVTDLSALAPTGREARVLALSASHAEQPFDLAAGPLFRAQLLQLGFNEHVLLLNMHHVISDGWSISVFHGDLAAAYEAFVNGGEPAWSALPLQYADYASWQRAWLQGEVLAAQRTYWQRQLADLRPLELPIDRPRPPVARHRGGRFAMDVPASLAAALVAVGHRDGATLFMTLLAAFQVLLSRYTGQTDIAVGSPIAGRARPELEGLIGFFVNTLVLRADLSGNPSFRALLAQVRETALEAYTYQDVPFEKLVEELAPARDLSRQPLFQVFFVLQNTPGVPLVLDGVAVSRLPRESQTAKFDLTLSARESAAGLHLRWEYASDLFDASTIERLASHFKVLLEAIVANPGHGVDDLPLLTPADHHQLVSEWNETTTFYPRDRTTHELVEAQAAHTPQAAAVMDGERELTYADLNTQANQLAHYLRSLGVRDGVPVGICCERSIELIVGVLGILKAGGAYVPLDPSYPEARLAFMLQDTEAPVLITRQALLDRLPAFDGHVLCLDRDVVQLSAQPIANPTHTAAPDGLAYIIYTSGSTGTPKGVAVRHRGITRLVCNTDYVELGPGDRIAHISNPAFDAATFEVWGALANGSSLVIISRDVALNLSRLADELRHRRVSTMFLTTALFNEVVRERADAFAGMKQLLFGGEAVDPHWVGECLRAGGPQRLLHVYGPTECTTFATWHPVEAVAPGSRTIPIGRPIANTLTYVLDWNRQPVPIGVAGELYVGGDGVARGYWNRPELTTEKFVPDPFSATPGARMYRTGDRVRYLVNGDLEFLGRLDDQVKIRGFRIELGEIEAVLGEHPGVRQAVVLAREDTPGDKRLVAYVVSADAPGPDIDSLRTFLRTRLPDYMRPAAYVVLERMPLTPTGKLDRPALPSPSRGLADATRGHELPRDAVEQTLCQLWADVLNVTQVGIDADFFELGGHSLLAAQLFARMDQAFGRSLPLATLFDAPTVRALARFYRDGAEPTAGTALVPITSSGSQTRVFAVPGVGGNVLGFTTLARDLGPEQPFFGLQSVGLDGAREPLESIEQMASHYLREVREIQPCGPYVLLGACFGATVAFEMTRQLLDAGEDVAFLGLFDPSSMGGDLAGERALPLPVWLKRGTAFASFVASRVRLYITQMRSLGYRQKVQLVGSKLKLVAEIVDKRDLLRGDHRKFHQRRVSAANLRALRRYKHEPLRGGPEVIEIFRTGRRVDRAPVNSGVDWASLAGRPIKHHNVPGKDSGDMLRGENAKALARLLSNRLQQVRRA